MLTNVIICHTKNSVILGTAMVKNATTDTRREKMFVIFSVGRGEIAKQFGFD